MHLSRSTFVLGLCFTSLCLGLLCSASDLETLIDLKRGFNNPKELASWNASTEGAPCNGWLGVTCQNNSEYVVKLALSRTFEGGQISPSIKNLTQLQELDLSANSLIGTIPSGISELKNLTSLNLGYNYLSGGLLQDWGNLTSLESLTLTGNHLEGAIPSSLSEAANLRTIRLEKNLLSDEIPPQIFSNLKRLSYFAIERNNIGGHIPEEMGSCVSLQAVFAGYNYLDGSIPDSVGNLTKLLHFNVKGNMLSGPIPESLGKLNNSLRTLDLSDNNFTGAIPTSLSKFNASSFANNPHLCGYPLLDRCSPGSYNAYPPASPQYGSAGRRSSDSKSTSKGSSSKYKIIGGAVGGAVGAAALLFLLFLLIRCRKEDKDQVQVQNWLSPDIQANRRKGRFEMFNRNFRYTYDDIVSNAGFFDTAHVLGKGRFATVYRSFFPDGTQLAVKVFKHANLPASFEKEIEMLAAVKHPNLLLIRGFYSNPAEKAIFYDFFPTGTLYDLLHGGGEDAGARPDWSARQRIALGVAQALAYLHRGYGTRVLHKDVKSTNILLETDLLPRLGDYGLVQLVSGRPQEVVETPGYTAPEVLTGKKYTEKSDVYSFGVVLLELITGKKAVSYIRERSVNLTNWVTRLHKEKRGKEVLDPVASKTCPLPEYLDRALNLAVLCVDANPNSRPTMSEVAAILEGLNSTPSPLRSPEMRFDRPLLP